MHGVEFVEGAQVLVGGVDVLPGRRHQEAQGAEQRNAAHQQAFEHVVEAHRVRAVGLHDGTHGIHVEHRRRHDLLAGPRPVAVALHGVDFAVVGEEAERLRQLPLRPRIGREALVEDRQARLETRVLEVKEKGRQVFRRHQTLVGQGVRVQGRDVEAGIHAFGSLFGQPAGHVEAALEVGFIHPERTVDEYLPDRRQRLERVLATGRRIGRHLAVAGHFQSLRFQRQRQGRQRGGSGSFLAADKHQTGCIEFFQRDAGLGRHFAQKAVRLAEQQAATVTGLAVGSHCPAVGQLRKRADRGGNQPVRRLIVQLGDQAEATAVLFKCRAVQRAPQPLLSFHVHLPA